MELLTGIGILMRVESDVSLELLMTLTCYQITNEKNIFINAIITCILTSRSHLETYKHCGLVSKFKRFICLIPAYNTAAK